MTSPSYLERLKLRRSREQIKKSIIFGLVFGWMLTISGWYNVYFNENASEAAWIPIGVLGNMILLLTLVIPQSLSIFENLLHRVGSMFFRVVFHALLIVQYYLVFTPLTLWLRGRSPDYQLTKWSDAAPADFRGWTPKTEKKAEAHAKGRRMAIFSMFEIFSYFLASGRYVIIPILIILILTGFALFFVQTSSLAPFIYSLF